MKNLRCHDFVPNAWESGIVLSCIGLYWGLEMNRVHVTKSNPNPVQKVTKLLTQVTNFARFVRAHHLTRSP